MTRLIIRILFSKYTRVLIRRSMGHYRDHHHYEALKGLPSNYDNEMRENDKISRTLLNF